VSLWKTSRGRYALGCCLLCGILCTAGCSGGWGSDQPKKYAGGGPIPETAEVIAKLKTLPPEKTAKRFGPIDELTKPTKVRPKPRKPR